MKLILFLSLSLFLFSCKPSYIFETNSTKPSVIKDDKGFYTYENDTLKIVYTFWAKSGVLAFSFYNKLNVPLYINWKRSSFVYNENKQDFWREEAITKRTEVKVKRGLAQSGVANNAILPLVTLSSSASLLAGNDVTVIPEKITFLAPKSYIFKAKFSLFTNDWSNLQNGWNKGILQNPSNQKDQIKIKYLLLKEAESPINFRNFITISTTEDFIKESYIDNQFYVSKITEIQKSKTYKMIHENRRTVMVNIFEKPSSFFLED